MQRIKREGEDPKLFGASNRRREPRLPLTFPIEVSGFDRLGRFFTEQSSCFDVGAESCAFRLHVDVEEESVLAIRSFHWQNNNVLDSRPMLFQVARIEKSDDDWVVASVRLQHEQPSCIPHGRKLEGAIP